MKMILSANEIAMILMVVITSIIFGLIIAAVIIKIVKFGKKSKVSFGEVDLVQKELFEQAYGGKENILTVANEMSRIIVEVKDLDLVKPESLKELGATGVLIAGNTIKASFQERAKNVYYLLK